MSPNQPYSVAYVHSSALAMFALPGGFSRRQTEAHKCIAARRSSVNRRDADRAIRPISPPDRVEAVKRIFETSARPPRHRISYAFLVRVRGGAERSAGRRPVSLHARTDESGGQHTARRVGQQPQVADDPLPDPETGDGGRGRHAGRAGPADRGRRDHAANDRRAAGRPQEHDRHAVEVRHTGTGRGVGAPVYEDVDCAFVLGVRIRTPRGCQSEGHAGLHKQHPDGVGEFRQQGGLLRPSNCLFLGFERYH